MLALKGLELFKERRLAHKIISVRWGSSGLKKLEEPGSIWGKVAMGFYTKTGKG